MALNSLECNPIAYWFKSDVSATNLWLEINRQLIDLCRENEVVFA